LGKEKIGKAEDFLGLFFLPPCLFLLFPSLFFLPPCQKNLPLGLAKEKYGQFFGKNGGWPHTRPKRQKPRDLRKSRGLVWVVCSALSVLRRVRAWRRRGAFSDRDGAGRETLYGVFSPSGF